MRQSIVLMIAIVVMTILSSCSQVTLLEPKNNTFTSDRTPTFRWAGPSAELWIDETPDFRTPLIIHTGAGQYTPPDPLDVGVHYWKVPGSEVRQFTIDGRVEVALENESTNLTLKNTGTVPLDLTRRSSIITAAVIAVGGKDTMQITEPTDLEVRQHG